VFHHVSFHVFSGGWTATNIGTMPVFNVVVVAVWLESLQKTFDFTTTWKKKVGKPEKHVTSQPHEEKGDLHLQCWEGGRSPCQEGWGLHGLIQLLITLRDSFFNQVPGNKKSFVAVN
jgi:hypothetical protein